MEADLTTYEDRQVLVMTSAAAHAFDTADTCAESPCSILDAHMAVIRASRANFDHSLRSWGKLEKSTIGGLSCLAHKFPSRPPQDPFFLHNP